MRKQTFIVALAMSVALQANAQTKGGGISAEMLGKIQKEQRLTAADNARTERLRQNWTHTSALRHCSRQ